MSNEPTVPQDYSDDRWAIPQTLGEAKERIADLALQIESIQNQLGLDSRDRYKKGRDWRHRATHALYHAKAEMGFLKQWRASANAKATCAPTRSDSDPASMRWLRKTLGAAVNVLHRLHAEGVDIGEDGRDLIEEMPRTP